MTEEIDLTSLPYTDQLKKIHDAEYDDVDFEYFCSSVSRNPYCIIVKNEDDIVMGFLIWGYDIDFLDDECGTIVYIYSLCVGSKWRRRGIGSELLTHLTSLYGYGNDVCLHVSIKNDNAISLYTKHKFKNVRRIDHYYDGTTGMYSGEGQHAYYMKRSHRDL
jgi:ribosomal protein S18 acetylase RimI-like enzyme